jgi:nicotinamide/nicotinate riboside kinase
LSQPEEDIPLHPVHGVKDWDAPATAIEWTRLRGDLERVKSDSTGRDSLDDAQRSHEHLSLLTEVPIDEARVKHWQERFQELQLAPDHRDTDTGTPGSTRTGAGMRHRFVLVDGFLMFYDQQISDLLDVRILIRARKDVLKARRTARNERVRPAHFISSHLLPSFLKGRLSLPWMYTRFRKLTPPKPYTASRR